MANVSCCSGLCDGGALKVCLPTTGWPRPASETQAQQPTPQACLLCQPGPTLASHQAPVETTVPAPTSLCAKQGGQGDSCPQEEDVSGVTRSEAQGVGQKMLYWEVGAPASLSSYNLGTEGRLRERQGRGPNTLVHVTPFFQCGPSHVPWGRPPWPNPGVRWLWQVEPLLGLAKAALLHPRPQRLGLGWALGLAGDPWGEGEPLTGSLGTPASPPVSLCTCA